MYVSIFQATSLNEIISRNSAFQQYVSTNNSNATNNNNITNKIVDSEQINTHDSRFSNPKNREWCVSHHPRLSNNLLNMGLPPPPRQFSNKVGKQQQQ